MIRDPEVQLLAPCSTNHSKTVLSLVCMPILETLKPRRTL